MPVNYPDETLDTLRCRFDEVCRRVFPEDAAGSTMSTASVENWDTGAHIKLIRELEVEFDLRIEPEAISALYSDADTILAYLRARGVTSLC